MGKRSNITRKGATLCASCHIDEFKKCAYVHNWEIIDGMTLLPIILKQGDEYTHNDKVITCPNYRREPKTRAIT